MTTDAPDSGPANENQTDSSGASRSNARSVLIETGDWAGWRRPDRDTFDTRSGPFYHKRDADGSVRCAFQVEKRHLNGIDVAHGGCLVTFADHAIFMFAIDNLRGGPSVTVSLNSEFIGAAYEGDIVEATGDVLKAGGSVLFVRGVLKVGERIILNYSGVIKKLKPKAAIPAPRDPDQGVD